MDDRRVPAETRKPKAGAGSKAGGANSSAAKAGSGTGRKRGRRVATPVGDADIIAAMSNDDVASQSKTVRTVASSLAPRTAPQRPRGGRIGAQDAEGRKARPVLRLLNGLLTLIVMLLLGVGGSGYYLQAAVDSDGPLKEAKLLVVPRNDGTQQIAERLEKDGMVGDRRMFLAGLYTLRMASMFSGGKPIDLKAGEYEIKPGASIRSIVDTLSVGRSVLMRVTIPEGLTSYQVVERLKSEAGLTGDLREIPAEGTLLPETYSLPRGSSRQTLIEMMQAAQKKLVDQLWAERIDGSPLKSTAEAIVLASIVEKETGRNDERDRVAAVFVNRLRKGMKIQSDPTILYGLMLGKVQWGKTIFLSDKNSKTAHNTYFIPGLPPTPICNPGRAAIEATLKPASVNDLFFVADGHGGHVFAETNREHEANVAKWRAIERERAGGAAVAPVAPAATQAPAPVTTTINAPGARPGASSLAPGAKAQAK